MVEIEKDYVFEGPDGPGEPARPVRGPPAADRRALHVRPELGRRLPELLGRRRRDLRRAARAPARPRHDVRLRLPRAAREDRALQGDARAGRSPGTRPTAATSTTTSTSRSTSRWRPSSTTSAPRPSTRRPARAGYVEGEQPIEMPGHELLPARRRRASSTRTRPTRRGAEMTGGSYYFLDLTALGRQEDWEEPKGRAERRARRVARLRAVTLERPAAPRGEY